MVISPKLSPVAQVPLLQPTMMASKVFFAFDTYYIYFLPGRYPRSAAMSRLSLVSGIMWMKTVERSTPAPTHRATANTVTIRAFQDQCL